MISFSRIVVIVRRFTGVGNIAVTERVIKTLKYEWLRGVPIIKGFDHLTSLCTEFESWYNTWRPHMTLEGLRPDDLYYSRKPETLKRDAKTVPSNIERHPYRVPVKYKNTLCEPKILRL